MNEFQNGDKIKIHERMAKVETRLDAIMENHLPHIQKAIDDMIDNNKEEHKILGEGIELIAKEQGTIKVQIARWAGGLAVGLFILQVALKFI